MSLQNDMNRISGCDQISIDEGKSIFINAGRGPIVVEEDLASALEKGEIAAAGLDVLKVEPMREDNPLFRIKDSTKLLITPHIGWAGVSTRKRLMDIIFGHIREYYQKVD